MAHLIDLKSISLAKIGLNVRNQPQCTVHWGIFSVHWGRIRELYIEADSVHWGQIRTLRQILCTVHWGKIGLNVWNCLNVQRICLNLLYIEADSVHWGQICTLRPNLCTVHWGKIGLNVQILFSDWLRGITWQNKLSLPQCTRTASIWALPQCTGEAPMRSILPQCTVQRICLNVLYIEAESLQNWPQCTESASMYKSASMYCTLRPNLCKNRPQCTESASMFKLASMYCTLRPNLCKIGLNVRNRPQCTESASMYSSLIGSDTSHEKINYLCLNVLYIEADSAHWGQFCLNVQLSDWLRPVHWGRFHTLRPIFWFSLTFDTNSTSDMKYQMC